MPHLVVVGGGIVGLSCAWSAQRRGWTATVIDRDIEGDRASHGNAGGIAVTECLPLSLAGMGLKPLRWLLDPLGPLSIRPSHLPELLPWYLALRKVSEPGNFRRIAKALAALNDQSLVRFEAMLADIGLSGDLHKRGALTVYERAQTFEKEQRDWDLKRSLGVRFRTVDADELRKLEPNLAPIFSMGVMLEDWAHIDDPLRIVEGLRSRVRTLGAEFVQGIATRAALDQPRQISVTLADGKIVHGDRLLIAAGAWSAQLARTVGDRALLESERGYNTTLPATVGRLNREVIFAERMFVATPLSIGLRIGGAAEFAGLESAADYRRSDALLRLARNYVPNLDEQGAKKWMGHRPSTPDSLPVIGVSPTDERVFYAFGHGHLGLTQSAATSEIFGDLLAGGSPFIDPAPYSISRFR